MESQPGSEERPVARPFGILHLASDTRPPVPGPRRSPSPRGLFSRLIRPGLSESSCSVDAQNGVVAQADGARRCHCKPPPRLRGKPIVLTWKLRNPAFRLLIAALSISASGARPLAEHLGGKTNVRRGGGHSKASNRCVLYYRSLQGGKKKKTEGSERGGDEIRIVSHYD